MRRKAMAVLSSLALFTAMAASPSAVYAKPPGTKTGGSWSTTECTPNLCITTICSIDHTSSPGGGAGYGSTGGTNCYTIILPINAELPLEP